SRPAPAGPSSQRSQSVAGLDDNYLRSVLATPEVARPASFALMDDHSSLVPPASNDEMDLEQLFRHVSLEESPTPQVSHSSPLVAPLE
ncbi:hypothetical protein ACHAQK_012224, partial [Fusarium lateritium]